MLTLILALHIAAGSLALAAMVVPLTVRKGGPLHRRAGWVFVGGMAMVSLTAFVLSAARIVTSTTADGRAAGLFLFQVALLTAAGVSAGVRVLRFKKRSAPHRHPWDLGLSGALVIASVGMTAFGLSTGRSLPIAFSVIGLLTGGGQLSYWLRTPSHPMHWWFEHLGTMIGSCIAATTAFLVVNASRMGLDSFGLLVWLTPTIVGVPLVAFWNGYYRRRFAGTLAPTPRHASPVPSQG